MTARASPPHSQPTGFHSGRVQLWRGDCREALRGLPDCSVDSVVTDPPYNLKFMGKEWDTGETAFDPEFWRDVLRVLKPGAHLLAMGGTRTYHRLACAIEDAGFEIRDMVAWMYGSGFPKSHDVSKGIDRAAGAEREIIGRKADPRYLSPADATSGAPMGHLSPRLNGGATYERAGFLTAPATDAAREWEGWGTALKPSIEPLCLARKPLSEKTIAANVLRWGTGALNIDGCRVQTAEDVPAFRRTREFANGVYGKGLGGSARTGEPTNKGRWPANVIHDGSDEVVGAFPESESSRSIVTRKPGDIYGRGKGLPSHTGEYGFNDSGSAARFFYTAKADADDRLGSKHPTVKPLDLIQYLIRLITPKGGTVLDMFAGSGTTAEAALRERMSCILCERGPEYQSDIERRMAHVFDGEIGRSVAIAKARPQKGEPMPLFPEASA